LLTESSLLQTGKEPRLTSARGYFGHAVGKSEEHAFAPQGGGRSRAWRTGDDEIEASGAMKSSGNFKAKQI
jgi:hypothetical protein